jgi:hypothetical protein
MTSGSSGIGGLTLAVSGSRDGADIRAAAAAAPGRCCRAAPVGQARSGSGNRVVNAQQPLVAEPLELLDQRRRVRVDELGERLWLKRGSSSEAATRTLWGMPAELADFLIDYIKGLPPHNTLRQRLDEERAYIVGVRDGHETDKIKRETLARHAVSLEACRLLNRFKQLAEGKRKPVP